MLMLKFEYFENVAMPSDINFFLLKQASYDVWIFACDSHSLLVIIIKNNEPCSQMRTTHKLSQF